MRLGASKGVICAYRVWNSKFISKRTAFCQALAHATVGRPPSLAQIFKVLLRTEDPGEARLQRAPNCKIAEPARTGAISQTHSCPRGSDCKLGTVAAPVTASAIRSD